MITSVICAKSDFAHFWHINRAYSLDNKLVKDWLANPSSYPEELKRKVVYLWKSRRASGGGRGVACLYWDGRCVIVFWDRLECGWSGNGPALLKPAV